MKLEHAINLCKGSVTDSFIKDSIKEALDIIENENKKVTYSEIMAILCKWLKIVDVNTRQTIHNNDLMVAGVIDAVEEIMKLLKSKE